MKNLIDSFNYAIKGFIYSLKTQRNMKIHVAITIIVLIVSVLTHLSKNEIIILYITITLVIAAELINTSIETIVDMISPQYSKKAEIAKNVAAGAVFLTAANAIFVGYFIFYDKFQEYPITVIEKVKQMPVHISFISFILVCIVVVIIKAINHTGTFIKGGMPSGHSALASCLFTSIVLLSGDALVSAIAFVMLVIVFHSRVEAGVHTIPEIIVGSILGIITTIIIFQLFNL